MVAATARARELRGSLTVRQSLRKADCGVRDRRSALGRLGGASVRAAPRSWSRQPGGTGQMHRGGACIGHDHLPAASREHGSAVVLHQSPKVDRLGGPNRRSNSLCIAMPSIGEGDVMAARWPKGEVTQGSAELDAPRALAELRRAFPGVMTWYGHHTDRWFALLGRGRGARLLEAASPADLGRMLNAAGLRSAHPVSGADRLMPAVCSTSALSTRPPSGSPCPAPPSSRSRGQHEAARRQGWVHRLLDAVTWNKSWSP